MEQIEGIGSYDWGAITYAAFLAGMRRKVTGEMGAFTGFWPFLLFWAFEYLDRRMFFQEPFAGVVPVLFPLLTSQILWLPAASWIMLMRPSLIRRIKVVESERNGKNKLFLSLFSMIVVEVTIKLIFLYNTTHSSMVTKL